MWRPQSLCDRSGHFDRSDPLREQLIHGAGGGRKTCSYGGGATMRIQHIFAALLGVFVLAACSDDMDMGDGPGLDAPMLMKVMPMEGALHLEWMNVQPDCDAVEAERMMPGEEFAQIFSVPGSVDNKMDAAATHDMTYTYRLRCKKGDAFSVYSEQLSANPTDE